MSKTQLSEVELLADLVAFDTTSSDTDPQTDKPNRACIEFIREYLDGFGIKSEILAANDRKANLWATLGPPEKSGGIVLSGHSDVVPVVGQNWTSDPFKLTERNGKHYGRGACDMKAFIACVLSIIPELAKAELKQPVHLSFTHDEETDMSGAARLTEYLRGHNVRPQWVWIGEPTDLHIINAHKGYALYQTSIIGVPGHSSLPDKGLNAVIAAAHYKVVLDEVAQGRARKPFAASPFDPPYTTLNIGYEKGGTAANIIAEHAEFIWELRPHPGDTATAFKGEVERLVGERIAPRFTAFAPRAGIKTCACYENPPLTPTKDNPGERILTHLTGHNQLETVSFATEAGYFQQLGSHVVVCGPGSIEQAHKADEFVAESQLKSCVDVLRKVLISSCPA